MNKIDFLLKLLLTLLKYKLACCISFFFPQKNLWLIAERGVDARDNGYHFYRYLRSFHPDIKTIYIISEKSNDINKFHNGDSVIRTNSIRHYLALARASHVISTHICGYAPDAYTFNYLDKKLNIFNKKKKIFLQHGIIKDNIEALHAENVNLDLFICGAYPEFLYVSQHYNHPIDVVRYTGLCRYDSLNDFHCEKVILIMPTWRANALKGNFVQSEYFITYSKLICNDKLSYLAEKFGYTVIFYPHHEFQKYISEFMRLPIPAHINIASREYDVQDLLKSSRLLITDYSSVYFDFAYMHKPIIFYQFDKEKYHYKKGYFQEENIGDVVLTVDQLLESLLYYLSNGCEVKPTHLANIDKLFVYRDRLNCERVFNAIMSV